MSRDTLIDFFDDLARARGQFLVYDDGFRTRSYAYAEVGRAARGCAARLADAGVRKGDKVVFWSENRAEWIAALWGCLLAGAVVVPIDYRTSAEFLGRVEREVRKYRVWARPLFPLRFLNLLPLSHMFGQAMATFIPPMLPGTVIFMRGYNPADIVSLIKRRRVSVLVSVPKILDVLRSHVSRVVPEPAGAGAAGFLAVQMVAVSSWKMDRPSRMARCALARARCSRRSSARAIVDPRPLAVDSIADTYKAYPDIGPILPAMGYGDEQVRDLEATIARVPCEVVVIGTPIDLSRLMQIRQPVVRVRYELQEIGRPDLADALQGVVEQLERLRVKAAS